MCIATRGIKKTARVGDQDVIVEACTRLGPPRLYFAGVETAVRQKNRACTRADCGSRAARRAWHKKRLSRISNFSRGKKKK